MEVFIDVWIEDRVSGERTKANEGIYTFVAVDDTGKPLLVRHFQKCYKHLYIN